MSVQWCSLFLMLAGTLLCTACLKTYDSQDSITCSQGLKHCTVINKNSVVPTRDCGPVEVRSFSVEAALCSNSASPYRPCLRVKIQLRILTEDEVSGDAPEVCDDEDHGALKLCYISPPNLQSCKEISFIVKPDAQKIQGESEVMVVVYDGVFLGSSVNVTVNRMSQVLHFPKHNSVCPSAVIEECKTPKIFSEIDKQRGVVELKSELEELLQTCMKRKGMSSCWLCDRTLPLHAVTHCMCFQAWRKNAEDTSSRSEICPFEDHEGFKRNAMKNVSFSVTHTVTNEGHPALSWTVSAPCRMEVEVWPCQMAVSLGGGCREVPGFRLTVSTGWDENISTLWMSDTFLNIPTSNNLLLCVMFKLDGKTFDPVCEREAHRGRWLCLLFVMLLVFFLLAVGVYVFRTRLKEWLSNSDSMHQSRGLHGQVLLVHSSGSDPSLSETVCWFATWLSDLGFSVSLDLWNQAAVSAMGPTPWLHSQLQQVQKQGGKTLLLLSHNAMLQARAFCETWSSALNKKDPKVDNTSWLWSSDIFSSVLSSLFSAQLQGGAAERFALVQLESETFNMPDLFQGLRLYQLPSESQSLLADLHTGHPRSLGARLKRLVWAWRASARLKRKLRNCEMERRSRTKSTLTQADSLNMEKETVEEKLPLHT